MSYLYAVNRDNPLGYFSIDKDYKYYQLKNDYVNKDYTALYDTFLPFITLGGYSYMNSQRTEDLTAKNNIPTTTGLNYFSPIVMGNSTSVKLSAQSSIDIKNVYDVFVPSANPHTWSAEFWACLDWQDGQGLDFTTFDSFTANGFRSDIGFRSSIKDNQGLSFGSLSTSSDGYPNILLLSIGYNTTFLGSSYFNNYASIIYNQKTNCIEFYVPQQDQTNGNNIYYVKSYAPVKNIDVPMHIYITYSNQNINVSVNGISGISAYVGDGLYSDTNILDNYYNLIFKFAGSYSYVDPASNTLKSLSLQPNQYVLLSNLTFYDYVLNNSQLANHIKWAFHDNYPVKSSIQAGTNFFSLEESASSFAYIKNFAGSAFNDYSNLYNLDITNEGLKPRTIGRVTFNNVDGTSVLNTPVDLSGAKWTGGKASLDFNDFGLISSNPCTISLIVEHGTPVTPVDEFIWSISSVNGSSTLFVDRSNGSYNLKYYDILGGGNIVTLATVSTANYSRPYHKIAVSLASDQAILTVVSAANETSTSVSDTTSQSTPWQQTFVFASNSILSIGQSYHIGNDLVNLKANSSTFSYLNISDLFITDFTNNNINGYFYANGYPWNGIIKYSCPLLYYYDRFNPVSITKSFTVYQMGSWVTTIPLSAVDSIVGSKIEWTSMNNCLVEYSFNNQSINANESQNWWCVSRTGAPITGYNFSDKLTNMRIRVTMITKYDVQDLNQSFNDLVIKFYRNLNYYSEGESFLILPKSRSTNGTSYTIKSHGKPIQSRSNNLGLLFAYSNSQGDPSVPGYAQIDNLYSKTITGVDFWYRADTNYQSSKILTGDTSVAGFPDLYIDSFNKICWNSNIKNVYVNGVEIPNGLITSSPSDIVSSYGINAYDPLHLSVIFNRSNLFSNPSFENDNNGWSSGQSGGVVRDNTTANNGTWSGRVTMSTNLISTTGTIGTVSGTGPYTATITGMSSTSGLVSGQVITATAGTGNFGAGIMTVSSVIDSTSITVSSTATFTAGTVTNINAYDSNLFTTTLVLNPGTYNLSAYFRFQSGSTLTGRTISFSSSTAGVTVSNVSVSTPSSTSWSSAGRANATITVTGSDKVVTITARLSNTANSVGQVIYADGWLLEAGNVLGSYIDNIASYAGDLYLNGTDVLNGAESSYGFINIWEGQMTQENAVGRYNLFVTNSQNNKYHDERYLNDNYLNSTSNPLNVDMRKDMLIPHRIGN